MRISIRPGDSGYKTHAYLRSQGKRAIVTFNGEHEAGAVTADTEAGMIVRYKIEEDGGLSVDPERECIMDEVVHGRVEIEVVDEMVL